jgi:histidinol dehydrogenase
MTDLELFASGPLSGLNTRDLDQLLDRERRTDATFSAAVSALMDDVRIRGDEALREMAQRFDGASLSTLEVPKTLWASALAELDPSVRAALERAASNIRRFHEAQMPSELTIEVEEGISITRAVRPLERAGVYAPGGTAAYPSSVLMGVIPARAAGVEEVVLCSPPQPSGLPPQEVLAAAEIAGAGRLLMLGGAGAVAALAYGTESVPRVDAIVGPGNRWVTEAKRQVAGDVVIDSPAGPSEVLVLADATANPQLVALEMLAQAEHDPNAACVLVATDQSLAESAQGELAALLADTPRVDIAREALRTSGAVLIEPSLEKALVFVDRYAPEHLSIMTAGAAQDARRVRNAGTIFVGSSASVAFGDYMTGANHVLPTAGRARSLSGLGTQHFLRSFTIQEVSGAGARSIAGDVALLATTEGLFAHASAARARKS